MSGYITYLYTLRCGHLRQLITVLQPKYLLKNHGVSINDILSYENGLIAALPMAYKEFLVLMGADKNFNAFCRAEHDFRTMASLQPPKHYPSYLFRIAHDADNDLHSPIDLFIDLREQGAYDTPLFEYEPYNEFRPEHVVQLRLSLMELLTRQLLTHFIAFAFGRICYFPSELIEHLRKMGYVNPIPQSKNFSYFTNGDGHVMIEIQVIMNLVSKLMFHYQEMLTM